MKKSGSKNYFPIISVSYQVARNKEITVATLGVFTWSLLQFTLVTTSMGKQDEDQEDDDEIPNQVNNHSTVQTECLSVE